METLKGKKTYLIAIAVAVVAALQNLGYLSQSAAETLLVLLGAGGLSTIAAKVNRLNAKLVLVPFLLLGFTGLAEAQAVSTDKLAWDQPAPDLVTAQAYSYKYYPDSAATGVALTGVICASSGTPVVITCRASFPAFTPGSHTLTLTASNAAGESGKSLPFTFTFVVVPGIPTTIRIEK